MVVDAQPSYQIWAKKMPDGEAALAFNLESKPIDISVELTSLGVEATSPAARDLWTHSDVPKSALSNGNWTISSLGPHACQFVRFSL